MHARFSRFATSTDGVTVDLNAPAADRGRRRVVVELAAVDPQLTAREVARRLSLGRTV